MKAFGWWCSTGGATGRVRRRVGEDFLRDADDIADLMADGAHLVGHSYGGLGVMFAAARRPDATKSLTLLEPGAFALGQRDPAARTLVENVRRIWNLDLPDKDWVVRFLEAVGSNPADLSAQLIADAVRFTPMLRHARPAWEGGLPLADLAAARFPKLVVSGGHNAGFEAICDDLAEQMAPRARSWPEPDTRSSSRARPSTRCCERSGARNAATHS